MSQTMTTPPTGETMPREALHRTDTPVAPPRRGPVAPTFGSAQGMGTGSLATKEGTEDRGTESFASAVDILGIKAAPTAPPSIRKGKRRVSKRAAGILAGLIIIATVLSTLGGRDTYF